MTTTNLPRPSAGLLKQLQNGLDLYSVKNREKSPAHVIGLGPDKKQGTPDDLRSDQIP